MSTLTNHQIRPRGTWFTVNRACNFRCLGCYAKGTGYSTNNDMTFELAEKLLALVSSLGINNIIIIGGEPTLWPDILKFNELCDKQGIKSTLVTNAMKFGIDSFWEQYQIFPNTKVGISVKAFDSKSLMQVANVNSFETTKKGIVRGIRLFKCGVSTFYNTESSDKLIDIAQFSMDCGARNLSISPRSPAFCDGKPDSTYVIHPLVVVQKILEMYPRLDEITKGKLHFSLKLPLCMWPKDFIEMLVRKNQINTVCQMHKRIGLIFDTNGRLAVCNSLFDYAIGKFGEDFVDRKSLLDLLNNQQVTRLHNKLTSYPSTKCVDCEKYDVCAGGCPLFWSLYNPQELIPGWV